MISQVKRSLYKRRKRVVLVLWYGFQHIIESSLFREFLKMSSSELPVVLVNDRSITSKYNIYFPRKKDVLITCAFSRFFLFCHTLGAFIMKKCPLITMAIFSTWTLPGLFFEDWCFYLFLFILGPSMSKPKKPLSKSLNYDALQEIIQLKHMAEWVVNKMDVKMKIFEKFKNALQCIKKLMAKYLPRRETHASHMSLNMHAGY